MDKANAWMITGQPMAEPWKKNPVTAVEEIYSHLCGT